MTIIGIDPGSCGGIVTTNGKVFIVNKFKNLEAIELFSLIKKTIQTLGYDKVYLEKVHSMPFQGVASTFKFGTNYGMIIGCLAALGIEPVYVTPQKWQKYYNLKREKIGGLTPYQAKKSHKNKLWKRAIKISGLKELPLDCADALLIAYYGYMEELSK
jgi:hypothetical protein